jgi:hypothetical protein
MGCAMSSTCSMRARRDSPSSSMIEDQAIGFDARIGKEKESELVCVGGEGVEWV